MATLKYLLYVMFLGLLALSPVFFVISFIFFGGSLYQIITVGRDFHVVLMLFGSGISSALFALMSYFTYIQFFIKDKVKTSHH